MEKVLWIQVSDHVLETQPFLHMQWCALGVLGQWHSCVFVNWLLVCFLKALKWACVLLLVWESPELNVLQVQVSEDLQLGDGAQVLHSVSELQQMLSIHSYFKLVILAQDDDLKTRTRTGALMCSRPWRIKSVMVNGSISSNWFKPVLICPWWSPRNHYTNLTQF